MRGSGKVPSMTWPPPKAYKQLDSAKGFLPKATKPCAADSEWSTPYEWPIQKRSSSAVALLERHRSATQDTILTRVIPNTNTRNVLKQAQASNPFCPQTASRIRSDRGNRASLASSCSDAPVSLSPSAMSKPCPHLAQPNTTHQ